MAASKATHTFLVGKLKQTCTILGWKAADHTKPLNEWAGCYAVDYNRYSGYLIIRYTNEHGGEQVVNPGGRMSAKELAHFLNGVQFGAEVRDIQAYRATKVKS